MTKNSLILLIIISLVNLSTIHINCLLYQRLCNFGLPQQSYFQNQWIWDAKYEKFAQVRVTVTEIRGIVWCMRFMIVCKKVKETISRNLMVVYWDMYERLKDLWYKPYNVTIVLIEVIMLYGCHNPFTMP